MKKYLVVCEETCPLCKGEGIVQHHQWRGFWDAHGKGPVYGIAFEQWFANVNGLDKYGQAIIPGEDVACEKCEAAGVIRSEVSLIDALGDLVKAVA